MYNIDNTTYCNSYKVETVLLILLHEQLLLIMVLLVQKGASGSHFHVTVLQFACRLGAHRSEGAAAPWDVSREMALQDNRVWIVS